MARKAASVQTGASSSSLNSKETPKVSKRGLRGEGHPSKQTPEVVSKLARAISLGLNDEESASLAGISDLTLTKWKRDPAFLRHRLRCDQRARGNSNSKNIFLSMRATARHLIALENSLRVGE
jgi:hypothetical protein